MFTNALTRSAPNEGGLPCIKTLLEDFDPLLVWPPQMNLIDGGHELTDFLSSSTPQNIEDVWDPKKDEDIFNVLGNPQEVGGKTRIERACSYLNISSDPEKWTQEQVLKWLKYSLRGNYSSPGLVVDEDWIVDGRGLCQMTLQDFKMRLPHDGEVLHAELDFWKSVHMTAGYNSVGSPTPYFVEDYTKDPMDHYAVLEPVDTYPSAGSILMSACQAGPGPEVEHKFVGHHNVLQADPNLQATSSCVENIGGVAFESQMPYWDSRELSRVIKAEKAEDMQSTVDDNSWMMHSAVTSSTNYYGNKPKMANRKWNVNRMSSDGLSRGMPEVMSTSHRRGKRTICLWQFLKELLQEPHLYSQAIRWVDLQRGIFKIEDSVRVARLWGERKNRPAMNYDKLSRSIRQYYKKGIIQKTTNSKRLVYQFCTQYM